MLDLFCVASGPSLTKEDCDLIAQSGVKVCCVNNAWQMFERIDYLYAGDMKWWRAYSDGINIPIGERWTCVASAARDFYLHLHKKGGPFNSGQRAIQWAVERGFKSIGLLGYDCSIKNGSHFHGDHKFKRAQILTDKKVGKWRVQFAKAAQEAKSGGVKVYNCSRETELVCFPRMSLEEALSRGVVHAD